MVRYAIFLVLSCVVVFSITIFFRLGGHKEVKISEGQYTPVALLYKNHIGAYHKINSVIEEVEKWAKEHNLPCSRTFGEYLDDPQSHEEARLRSRGGCILDGVESLSLAEPMPLGMAIKELEVRPYVIAEFEGAPSIGPMKVYPKVEKYMAEKKLTADGPVIEVYNIFNDREAKTEYLFPVKGP